MVAFELAVQDAHGLDVAARLAVDRIELCSALPLGGVTPSLGFVEAAVATPGVPPVHPLVRPRPGGFEYDAAELAVIISDVRHVLSAGAAGVVVGGLRGGKVDAALVERVVEAAGGADVTFHRAFDNLPDPYAGIDDLVRLGVRRILTSAGAAHVADALPALAGLVEAAGGRIEIMAGGGVRPGVVEKIVATGVPAVHASAKRVVLDPGVSLGTADGAGRETTDEAEALRMIEALGRRALS
jgi:copper homeostasis protein